MIRWCLVCVRQYDDGKPLSTAVAGGCCDKCDAERKSRLSESRTASVGGESCVKDPSTNVIQGTIPYHAIIGMRSDVRWYKKAGSNGDG